MSQLTTHILDTTVGKPANGVTIIIFREIAGQWKEYAKGITNQDGRVRDWEPTVGILDKGNYKLRFLTQDYFSRSGLKSFYPYVEVVFEINSSEHYHVPLLLNPYGYSTYRGS